MAVIGYEKAKNLMVQLDWKLRVTMSIPYLVIQSAEVYHPKQSNVYTLRRDSAKRLIPECRVCGRVNDETAILCYDHDGSNEDLI